MRDLFGKAPTKPAASHNGGPLIHYCAREGCGAAGASCGIAGQWFCVRCAPADFWPDQGEAA